MTKQITVSDATYSLIVECNEILRKKDGYERSANMTLADVCLAFLRENKKNAELMSEDG